MGHFQKRRDGVNGRSWFWGLIRDQFRFFAQYLIGSIFSALVLVVLVMGYWLNRWAEREIFPPKVNTPIVVEPKPTGPCVTPKKKKVHLGPGKKHGR